MNSLNGPVSTVSTIESPTRKSFMDSGYSIPTLSSYSSPHSPFPAVTPKQEPIQSSPTKNIGSEYSNPPSRLDFSPHSSFPTVTIKQEPISVSTTSRFIDSGYSTPNTRSHSSQQEPNSPIEVSSNKIAYSRYSKRIASCQRYVQCVLCSTFHLPKHMEQHFIEQHSLNPATSCVWCGGTVQWKRLEKNKNVLHLEECFRLAPKLSSKKLSAQPQVPEPSPEIMLLQEQMNYFKRYQENLIAHQQQLQEDVKDLKLDKEELRRNLDSWKNEAEYYKRKWTRVKENNSLLKLENDKLKTNLIQRRRVRR